MALDKKTFRTRTLTAIVFAAVMLLGLFWNFKTFFILFSIVHFGCWFEYLKIIEKIYNTKIDIVVKYFFAICGFTLIIVLGVDAYPADFMFTQYKISGKLILWIFEIVGLGIWMLQNKIITAKAKWMSFGGLIYIALPLALLINLRDQFTFNEGNVINTGLIFSCAIIFSIWINDTMAYIVGSFIGKTPFSKISPKKTWEGTAGGAILCVVVIAILGTVIPAAKTIAVHHWIFIAAICAVFGTLGDLLESKLKRNANIKDSGNFMPGHGGFLDRFDSLLLAAPAVWVYVRLFL